jgi:hypothetical protein
MSDLTNKFSTLEEQLTAEHTEMQDTTDNIYALLGTMSDLLTTIQQNNALNARYLLAAIGQNSPCAPCPTPSLSVPPTDTTPRAVNTDKCKRAQAFLHAMAEIMTVMDVTSAFSIALNPSLIGDAIGQVITALENGDTTPLPSYPEATQIVGTGINYVAGNIFVGTTLSSQFSTVVFDLQSAIYSASSSADMQSVFGGVIDGSSIVDFAKPLIKALGYNALFTYYFDPASDPNIAGYSGTVCAEAGGCLTITSSLQTISGAGPYSLIVWPSDFDPVDVVDGTTSSGNVWATIDMEGWSIHPALQSTIFVYSGDHGTTIDANDTYVIPTSTTFVAVIHAADTSLQDVEVCPP